MAFATDARQRERVDLKETLAVDTNFNLNCS